MIINFDIEGIIPKINKVTTRLERLITGRQTSKINKNNN